MRSLTETTEDRERLFCGSGHLLDGVPAIGGLLAPRHRFRSGTMVGVSVTVGIVHDMLPPLLSANRDLARYKRILFQEFLMLLAVPGKSTVASESLTCTVVTRCPTSASVCGCADSLCSLKETKHNQHLLVSFSVFVQSSTCCQ